jgi:hypothetical protein
MSYARCDRALQVTKENVLRTNEVMLKAGCIKFMKPYLFSANNYLITSFKSTINQHHINCSSKFFNFINL